MRFSSNDIDFFKDLLFLFSSCSPSILSLYLSVFDNKVLPDGLVIQVPLSSTSHVG